MESKLPAIVLIEKDTVTLDLYRRELSKSFEVLSFMEVKGVLETMAGRQVQAVIIEPEIDAGQGWELIHSIHETYPGNSIPVIVCSTRDSGEPHFPGSVSKHLTKPVLPKELKEKTLEVLKKRNEFVKTS